MNDIEKAVPLQELDPGLQDNRYWSGLQVRIMGAVRPELARRALLSPFTLGDALLGWGRLVLPTTLAAAAVAAVLLLREPVLDGVTNLAGLEELLLLPRDGEAPLPAFLHQDDLLDRDMVLLALEEF